MKELCIIFTLILLSSCSSFEMMRYRHIKKVPATPPQFSAGIQGRTEADASVNSVVGPETVQTTAEVISRDTLPMVTAENSAAPVQVFLAVDSADMKTEQVIRDVPVLPVRKDYSLFIAAMMILAGIILIIFGILTVPYFNIFLLLRLVIGALYLFAAWRLIKNGVIIFISRFRNDKRYKEN